MKRIFTVSLVFLLLLACSKSEDKNTSENLNEQNLLGTWFATKLSTDNGENVIGQEYCYTKDSSELHFSGNCSGTEVEECRVWEEFSIRFDELNLYERIEYNPEKSASIDSNNCEITYFENDFFKSTAKGTWSYTSGDNEIVLEETYALIELLNYGEEYSREDFDIDQFTWKIISFTDSELQIFWRTPDQFDVEIHFEKR